jgi:hypothetical protein
VSAERVAEVCSLVIVMALVAITAPSYSPPSLDGSTF